MNDQHERQVQETMARARQEEQARVVFLVRVANAQAAGIQSMCAGNSADVLQVLVSMLAGFAVATKSHPPELHRLLDREMEVQKEAQQSAGVIRSKIIQ